jgi:hypothetical protein
MIMDGKQDVLSVNMAKIFEYADRNQYAEVSICHECYSRIQTISIRGAEDMIFPTYITCVILRRPWTFA